MNKLDTSASHAVEKGSPWMKRTAGIGFGIE